MELDWEMIERIGITGVSLFAIYFLGYRMVLLFIRQWKTSTEAINRNTESFKRLTEVFEIQASIEKEFQKETLGVINEHKELSRQTNRMVNDLHNKFIDNIKYTEKEENNREHYSKVDSYQVHTNSTKN